MDLEKAAASLASSSLFRGIEPEVLEGVAEQATERRYRKGEFLFLEGDPGQALFVLVEGHVKVFVTSNQGEELVLVTVGPPESLGELSLIDGRDRSASAQALEPTLALVIRQDAWKELAGRHPSLAQGMVGSLGALLRRLTGQTADLVFLDLPGRVARLLLGLAEERGRTENGTLVLDLHVTQSDLARMVGGSRQSVNQILGTLRDRGFLEVENRTLTVKDLDGLRRRAGIG